MTCIDPFSKRKYFLSLMIIQIHMGLNKKSDHPSIPITFEYFIFIFIFWSTRGDSQGRACYFPWLSSMTGMLSLQRGEVPCNRFCAFEKIGGNMYQCNTHLQLHVCDSSCQQKIRMDNFSEICRLSKKVSPIQAMSDGQVKKRGIREDGGEPLVSKRSREIENCAPHSGCW